MGAYCRAIWQCRYFWLSLVRMDLRSRYRGSVLGLGWSLLQPLAMTAIFTLVFCRVFNQNPGWYAPYVLTGLACWSFILYTVLQGCNCFFQGEAYIRQFPAPMAVYPLRTMLAGAFHFVVALGVATALAAVNLGNFRLGALLSLVPALLLLLVFGWSLAVLAGLATVWFRDTRHLSEVAFQVFFYVTPIIYEPRLLEGGHLQWVLEINPFLPFLTLLREPILSGNLPALLVFGKALVVTAGALSLAMFCLARLERKLIFHL